MIQPPVPAEFPCLELSLPPLSERSLNVNQLILCMDSEEGRVLVQNWLCLNMTEQTTFLYIILHTLKSADKLPLFIILFVAMVAVCVDCYQEKQYCQTLTDGPESSKQRSSDKKLV